MAETRETKKAKLAPLGELESLMPVLTSLEESGHLLEFILDASREQPDQELLAKKFGASLPDIWIKAPDQRLMLLHNWKIQGQNDEHDGEEEDEQVGLKLHFKSNKILLGGNYGDAKVLKRDDLYPPKDDDSISYHIDLDSGDCCQAECYDFELQLNPKTDKYKLRIEEYLTCRDACDDGITEYFAEII